jgi:hypothetical protein
MTMTSSLRERIHARIAELIKEIEAMPPLTRQRLANEMRASRSRANVEPRSLLFNARDGKPDPQYIAGLWDRFS